jgi:PIN domain nuclease of toxin-antitoxin system
MKILLDTHTLLWFFDDVEKLSKPAYDAILNPENYKYVSIASAWEVAIKVSTNKLTFEGGVANFLETVRDNGFNLLPVHPDHIKRVENLSYHHRDPFDRILVASAASEGMCLVSSDENIKRYDIDTVW